MDVATQTAEHWRSQQAAVGEQRRSQGAAACSFACRGGVHLEAPDSLLLPPLPLPRCQASISAATCSTAASGVAATASKWRLNAGEFAQGTASEAHQFAAAAPRREMLFADAQARECSSTRQLAARSPWERSASALAAASGARGRPGVAGGPARGFAGTMSADSAASCTVEASARSAPAAVRRHRLGARRRHKRGRRAARFGNRGSSASACPRSAAANICSTPAHDFGRPRADRLHFVDARPVVVPRLGHQPERGQHHHGAKKSLERSHDELLTLHATKAGANDSWTDSVRAMAVWAFRVIHLQAVAQKPGARTQRRPSCSFLGDLCSLASLPAF